MKNPCENGGLKRRPLVQIKLKFGLFGRGLITNGGSSGVNPAMVSSSIGYRLWSPHERRKRREMLVNIVNSLFRKSHKISASRTSGSATVNNSLQLHVTCKIQFHTIVIKFQFKS